MPAPRDLSCYVLELSVSPGGSRWAELHAYSDPAHIRACLEDFCSNGAGTSAYHAIWYGATLGVWVVQAGDVVDFIDVYPSIDVRLGDRGPVPLCDDDATRKLLVEERVRRVNAERAGQELDEDDDTDDDIANEHYNDVDMDIYEAMELSLDWARVAARLPALTPPLLDPGARTHLRFAPSLPSRGYLAHKSVIKFGSRDQESGEVIDTSFKVALPADADDGDDEDWEDEDEDEDDEEEDEENNDE